MNEAVPKRIAMTGVSRGLGRALTEAFAAQGHTVLGCARSAEAVDELRRELGSPHSFEVVDVAQDEQVWAWARDILDDGGPPELLINNAGVINRNAPLWEVPDEEFSLLMDVNLRGVANVLRWFLPAMTRRREGVIVNVSSGWGRTTAPEVAPYCATKWGIEGMTLALAEELPSGMAAVAVNPGIINTDMLQSCFGEAAGSYPDARAWARRAAPFLLGLGPNDNGRPASVP